MLPMLVGYGATSGHRKLRSVDIFTTVQAWLFWGMRKSLKGRENLVSPWDFPVKDDANVGKTKIKGH
jgi:hypothetical protein